MKKLVKTIFYLILTSVIFCACSTLENNSGIKRINYGTSFGECIGYCRKDIEITQNNQTTTCASWNNTLKDQTHSENTNMQIWNSLKVNFDSLAFFSLANVIGCPDCADGGSEWLEIELTNGRKHKVTYEYNNTPDEIEAIVSILRDLFNEFSCVQ